MDMRHRMKAVALIYQASIHTFDFFFFFYVQYCENQLISRHGAVMYHCRDLKRYLETLDH